MLLEILTVEQVAKLLHLHAITIYRLAKEGRIPAFKVGGRWRFNRDDLEYWMRDQAKMIHREAEDRQREGKS